MQCCGTEIYLILFVIVLFHMTSIEVLEKEIEELMIMNKRLEERVSSLELQIAQITERALKSCSSCSLM